jgi:hypothetical protein
MIFITGTIENYNNNILIATENMKPGKNNININNFLFQPLAEGPSIKSNKLKTNNPIPITKNINLKFEPTH